MFKRGWEESKERGVDSRSGPHNEGGTPIKYALSCTIMNHQPELLLNWNGGGEGGRGFVGGGGGGLHPLPPLPLVFDYCKEALVGKDALEK